MATYGRKKTSDSAAGTTGTNTSNQRGQIFGAFPEHGWVTSAGVLGGKKTGMPNLTGRIAAYDVSGATLDDRLHYTSSVTISNVATSGADGAQITMNFSTAWQAFSGTKYGLAFSVIGGEFIHAMSPAANNPPEPDDFYFHFKNNGSSIPTDPFSASSSSYEGSLDIWLTYLPNMAPSTDTFTMTPSGTINTATPDFEGEFLDPDAAQGDVMKQFQVQVRRVSDDVIFWDTTQSATSGEQAANQFTTTYAGTALVAGTAYEWRYRVSDQFGVWSSWSHTGSSWLAFTVNAGGSVSTSAGTPTGKQETQAPTPFTGVWSHASALSTNAVEVRVKQGSTVVRTSPTITKSVANGGTISVTWAETTFANLSWGIAYTYQIRARDTGGLWSEWSAGRAFNTNASPTVPSNLFPSGGSVRTTPPKLSLVATDVDDTTASGLSVSARIKDAGGTLIQTRTMVYNAGIAKWEYQTIAGVNEVQRLTRAGTISGGTFTITVPANVLGGPFTTAAINWNDPAATIQTKLEALANVGTGNVLVTGGPVSTTNVDLTFRGALGGINLSQITHTSSLTGGGTLTPSTVTAGVPNDLPTFATYKWDARSTDDTITTAYSSEQTFIYAVGPVVTVTAPADLAVLTTNTPTITFSQDSTQATYRIKVYTSIFPAVMLVYDSGDVASVVGPGTPVNHQIPSGYLHNNTSYFFDVTSVSNLGLSGESASRSFSIAFPAPAGPTGFTVSTIRVGNDVSPSATLLAWDEPGYSADVFAAVITRRLSGQDASQAKILARLTSPSQARFIDYYPVSHTQYTYGLYFEITQGTDTTETTAVEGDALVTLEHVVISSVTDGSLHLALRYGEPMALTHGDDWVEALPWGQESPHIFMGDYHAHALTGSFELQTDRYSTGRDDLAMAKAIHMVRDVVCYRDQFGDRIFGYMRMKETKGQRSSVAQIDISITETDYQEGEVS